MTLQATTTSACPGICSRAMQSEKVSGQALTEFLVLAAALIPLFLLIPVIAKYQDIAHSTQMASRYVAFEAMTRNDAMSTWKPAAQLSDEVRRRFFSNPDAPIKTNDTAGDFKANQNLFWRDPQGRSLITSFGNDVTVSFGAGQGADHGAAFSSASDGKPFTLRNEFGGLQARGIYTANVNVRVANLPSGLKNYEPFDKINLNITRSTSVVIDPWAANSPVQAESRFSGNATIFPASALKQYDTIFNAAVGIIDAPGGIPAPKLGQLDFWRDVVPEDRLKAAN